MKNSHWRTANFTLFFTCYLLLVTASPLLSADSTDLIYSPTASQPDLYTEPVNLIVQDALGSPGREVILRAKVEYRDKKIFKSVSNTSVRFLVEGSTIGEAETNKSGIASVNYVPENYGDLLISAQIVETDLFRAATGYALLSVLSSTKPILLIDYDSALYKGLSVKFQLVGIERLKPIDGAAAALHSLSERYSILYMTEWSESDLPKIRKLIYHWKIPKSPVLFWNMGTKVLTDSNWKTKQLSKLLKDWKNIKIGVGGTSDVMRAFRNNNIKAIPVSTTYLHEPSALDHWKEVKKEIDKIGL